MEQLIKHNPRQPAVYPGEPNQSHNQNNILRIEETIRLTGKNSSQRMNTLYHSFIMSFLKENHPEILKSIDKIYESDLSKINKVIDCYCQFVGIPPQQIMGEYINYKDIQHRYKAIAVVLRIFQPEKLPATNLTYTETSNERSSKLQIITLLIPVSITTSDPLPENTSFSDKSRYCYYKRINSP